MSSTTARNGAIQASNVSVDVSHHIQLLNIIERLKRAGVEEQVLPRLVVCGDQSSGKSSTLETISGQRFPTLDTLCTRFATELVLRPSSEQKIVIRIIPASGRSIEEQKRLEDFHPASNQLGDLAEIIESAGKTISLGQESGSEFTDDRLRVELTGPGLPPLSLVDLPGFFHSGGENQTDADVEFVQELVRRYMRGSNTIILAVVSAKSDPATQIVLKYVAEEDPKGQRTLGVITKPDMLEGAGLKRQVLKLAQNRTRPFRHGWHILKGRTYEQRNYSNEQRDASEAEFLAKESWAQLSDECKGAKNLKARLVKIFSQLNLFLR